MCVFVCKGVGGVGTKERRPNRPKNKNNNNKKKKKKYRYRVCEEILS